MGGGGGGYLQNFQKNHLIGMGSHHLVLDAPQSSTHCSHVHIWSTFGTIIPNHLNMPKPQILASGLLNWYTNFCPDRGGGGANTKVPDMYGVGGCFRDPKHKSNMYTFVQQRGVSIFYPESQKYKWYFCTHKILKNYEKMTNFYTNFYIFFNELLL